MEHNLILKLMSSDAKFPKVTEDNSAGFSIYLAVSSLDYSVFL